MNEIQLTQQQARELVGSIIDNFEELLETYEMQIPHLERYHVDEKLANIYGEDYYQLEADVLKDLEKHLGVVVIPDEA